MEMAGQIDAKFRPRLLGGKEVAVTLHLALLEFDLVLFSLSKFAESQDNAYSYSPVDAEYRCIAGLNTIYRRSRQVHVNCSGQPTNCCELPTGLPDFLSTCSEVALVRPWYYRRVGSIRKFSLRLAPPLPPASAKRAAEPRARAKRASLHPPPPAGTAHTHCASVGSGMIDLQ